MKSPIKKISLQSEITKYIQDYIKEENLQCGDPLPSQVEMTGVSRTALREAIRVMEGQGLLDVRNGKGVFVGEHYQQEGVQMTISFAQEKEKLLEILEVRSVMEKEILKLVVHRITDEEIEHLGELTRILMKKFRAKEPKAAEDKAFHEFIYSCCHNEVMFSVLRSVCDWLDKLWAGHPLGIEEPFEKGLPYHEKLYEAIRERDYRKAWMADEYILNNLWEEIGEANLKWDSVGEKNERGT